MEWSKRFLYFITTTVDWTVAIPQNGYRQLESCSQKYRILTWERPPLTRRRRRLKMTAVVAGSPVSPSWPLSLAVDWLAWAPHACPTRPRAGWPANRKWATWTWMVRQGSTGTRAECSETPETGTLCEISYQFFMSDYHTNLHWKCRMPATSRWQGAGGFVWKLNLFYRLQF